MGGQTGELITKRLWLSLLKVEHIDQNKIDENYMLLSCRKLISEMVNR